MREQLVELGGDEEVLETDERLAVRRPHCSAEVTIQEQRERSVFVDADAPVPVEYGRVYVVERIQAGGMGSEPPGDGSGFGGRMFSRRAMRIIRRSERA